jgi:ubiquinol-cytochrome c reductase cytochrome b subunit
LPFVILALVIGHLYFLHKGNSSNPLGVLVTDRIAFHPYIVLKDLIGVIGVLLVYFTLVLRNSNLLGHSDNYIQANSMVTPGHIVPE